VDLVSFFLYLLDVIFEPNTDFVIGTELAELSERPHFLKSETVRASDIAFNNNGRLAAKFLRSFFEEEV